ncbi:pathogenesis-related protein 1-like [Cannabis sativa]|uniref:pathogenesis-related protein 1-like n=1 Tax=Cannabis sativa TaxID=3483 RepID=UPI0029CA12FF|nr:pathogenesis-related protein 1-like [Cannabis sativa]
MIAPINSKREVYNGYYYIREHNKIRGKVGVSPVTWNNTLQKYAAERVISLNTHSLKYVPLAGPYGENFAKGEPPVMQWENEQANYDYITNKCKKNTVCNNYTQLVWNKSTDIGCERSGLGNDMIAICYYYPSGNKPGERPYATPKYGLSNNF